MGCPSRIDLSWTADLTVVGGSVVDDGTRSIDGLSHRQSRIRPTVRLTQPMPGPRPGCLAAGAAGEVGADEHEAETADGDGFDVLVAQQHTQDQGDHRDQVGDDRTAVAPTRPISVPAATNATPVPRAPRMNTAPIGFHATVESPTPTSAYGSVSTSATICTRQITPIAP